jgi:hypothetical protein
VPANVVDNCETGRRYLVHTLPEILRLRRNLSARMERGLSG